MSGPEAAPSEPPARPRPSGRVWRHLTVGKGGEGRRWTVSRTNKLLAVVLIYLVFVMIIIYPGLSQYPATTGWGVGIDHGRQYIVDHGHIPKPEQEGTWQGQLTNYGSQDVASKIEFSIINIITGTEPSEDGVRFLNIFIFSKVLLMPLFGVLIYCWMTGWRSRSIRDMALIGLFAMMPIASALPASQDAGVAGNLIAMALLLPMLALVLNGNSPGKKLLLFLIVVTFLLLWHTWSLYFLIFSFFLFIGSLVDGNVKLRSVTSYCIIAYLLVGAYLNYDQLIGFPGATILSIFSLDYAHLPLAFTSSEMAYRTGASLFSILQITSSALIVGVICFTNLRILRKRRETRSAMERFIFWLSIGLAGCWLALFLLGGPTTLLARVLEPSIPVSIICAAYLLAGPRAAGDLGGRVPASSAKARSAFGRRSSLVVPAVLVVLMLLCAYSHLASPTTPSEFYGAETSSYGFVDVHGDRNSSYFSDFRMGTRLAMYDYRFLYTMDKASQGTELYDGLLSIYYDRASPEGPLSDLIGDGDHYVITSRYQSIKGIADPNQNLRPAVAGFENNFRLSSAYINLYTNGDAKIWAHYA